MSIDMSSPIKFLRTMRLSHYEIPSDFMLDMHDQLDKLEQELQKTREQLDKAEKVIEFYADGDNYGHISPEIATYSVIDASDLGDGDFMLNDSVDDERVGGKRARQYFKDKTK